MWRGRLARLVLAVAVGVLAVVVINSFRQDGSSGADDSTAGGGGGGSSASVAARWDGRLDLLSDRTGDCQTPTSAQCGTLMEDVTLTLSGLGDDISSAGTSTDYSDTQADVARLESDVNDYEGAGCSTPVGLGTTAPSVSCDVDTAQVTAGIFPLRAALDADESGPGAG